MEFSGCFKTNLSDVIQKIKQTCSVENKVRQKAFFPYIENYFKGHGNEDSLRLTRNVKLRETFMHHTTLKYDDPSFTCERSLSRIANKVRTPDGSIIRHSRDTVKSPTNTIKDCIYPKNYSVNSSFIKPNYLHISSV